MQPELPNLEQDVKSASLEESSKLSQQIEVEMEEQLQKEVPTKSPKFCMDPTMSINRDQLKSIRVNKLFSFNEINEGDEPTTSFNDDEDESATPTPSPTPEPIPPQIVIVGQGKKEELQAKELPDGYRTSNVYKNIERQMLFDQGHSMKKFKVRTDFNAEKRVTLTLPQGMDTPLSNVSTSASYSEYAATDDDSSEDEEKEADIAATMNEILVDNQIVAQNMYHD